eukprot:2846506-Pyramimonas_sp.AAC.1
MAWFDTHRATSGLKTRPHISRDASYGAPVSGARYVVQTHIVAKCALRGNVVQIVWSKLCGVSYVMQSYIVASYA